MVEPENLVLEHLRAIRGDVAKLADWMQTMSTEMTAMRHHLFGAITTQNHDHVDLAEVKVRLDRIEKRLDSSTDQGWRTFAWRERYQTE